MRISGVGVIDFESWRPTYRQNWASLNIYRDKSKANEKKLHPYWSKDRIESEVSTEFGCLIAVLLQMFLIAHFMQQKILLIGKFMAIFFT
jgi:Hyaluronidase